MMERSFKDKRAYKGAPMSSIIGSVNDFRRSRCISLFRIPFRERGELAREERPQLATVLRGSAPINQNEAETIRW